MPFLLIPLSLAAAAGFFKLGALSVLTQVLQITVAVLAVAVVVLAGLLIVRHLTRR